MKKNIAAIGKKNANILKGKIMAKNEKTSKKIARQSAIVLNNAPVALGDIKRIRVLLDELEVFVRSSASSAASALTQAPDRKKRK